MVVVELVKDGKLRVTKVNWVMTRCGDVPVIGDVSLNCFPSVVFHIPSVYTMST